MISQLIDTKINRPQIHFGRKAAAEAHVETDASSPVWEELDIQSPVNFCERFPYHPNHHRPEGGMWW